MVKNLKVSKESAVKHLLKKNVKKNKKKNLLGGTTEKRVR